MAKLIIEGDKKQLEIIAKSEKGRANKYNLKISLVEPKKREASKPPVKKEPKPKKKN